MKKILIVSYHFPPDAAVGAIRAAKFARYFPEFGWRPYVLTVKEKYYDMLDRSRMSDVIVPEKVFRTWAWPHPPPAVLYLRLKKWMYCLTGKRHIFEEKVNTYPGPDRVRTEGKLGGLRRVLRSLLVAVEGELGWLGWVLPATFKGLLLVRRYRINCLYTSGPPHAAHLVGLAIKILYGVRWVADFRDPWTMNTAKQPYLKSRLSERIEGWLEKQVVNHADKIISVTERMSQAFMMMHPKIDKAKFATIPNGYDPEDYSDLPKPMGNGKFRVSYLGSFYLGRTPAYFLKAVRELIDEGKLSYHDLEIRFIGHCRYIAGQSVEGMARQEGLFSVVQIMDPLPYRDALREMVGSDLLLLFAPDQRDQVPGKAFEYLASGADIIAFTSEGATADIIRITGRGVVVEPDSIQQIKEALEACYRKYHAGNCGPRDPSLSQQDLTMYHRRTLTSKLVSALE
jgi:glycosyltransferase involved in cell wall biosynthesis